MNNPIKKNFVLDSLDKFFYLTYTFIFLSIWIKAATGTDRKGKEGWNQGHGNDMELRRCNEVQVWWMLPWGRATIDSAGKGMKKVDICLKIIFLH